MDGLLWPGLSLLLQLSVAYFLLWLALGPSDLLPFLEVLSYFMALCLYTDFFLDCFFFLIFSHIPPLASRSGSFNSILHSRKLSLMLPEISFHLLPHPFKLYVAQLQPQSQCTTLISSYLSLLVFDLLQLNFCVSFFCLRYVAEFPTHTKPSVNACWWWIVVMGWGRSWAINKGSW